MGSGPGQPPSSQRQCGPYLLEINEAQEVRLMPCPLPGLSLKWAEVSCITQVVRVLFLVLRAEPAGVANENERPVNYNRNV